MSTNIHKQKNKERMVKEHFETIGGSYNSIMDNRSFRYYLARRSGYLSDFCRQYKDNSIMLDLASGTSSYLESILNYKRLLNIDISFNALRASALVNDKVTRINANALHIPLRDNTIDRIILIGLLHHIPNSLPALFKELNRVLKEGGLIFIDDANGYNLFWFLFIKFCEIDRIGAAPIFPSRLRKIASLNRLHVEKEFYWGFVPPGLSINKLISLFDRLGSLIEKSFFSCFCTRYQLILRK